MLRITTCFAFGLLFVATHGVSQNQKVVDSLERVLTTATGSDRWSPLIDLAIEFVDNDNDRALSFIEQAHSTALTSGIVGKDEKRDSRNSEYHQGDVPYGEGRTKQNCDLFLLSGKDRGNIRTAY